MSRPGEDPRRGCQGSEEGTWDEECVGKGTEGKEFVQTMRRGSHTPCPVGRRIASLIPPAHDVAPLAFTRAFVAMGFVVGLEGVLGPIVGIHRAWTGLSGAIVSPATYGLPLKGHSGVRVGCDVSCFRYSWVGLVVLRGWWAPLGLHLDPLCVIVV